MTHASVASDHVAKSDFRVGRVISRSASVLSRHFLTFFIVTLIAHLPIDLLTSTRTTAPTDLDQALSLLVAWLAVLALIALSTLGEAVILHGAFWDIRRGPVRLAESLSAVLRHVLPIGGLAFVSILSIQLGFILLIIPGLILCAMWFVAGAACVVERLGPWTSLRRSYELTKGHRWKLFGLVLLLIIPSLGIKFALDAVASPIVAAIGKWVWSGFW